MSTNETNPSKMSDEQLEDLKKNQVAFMNEQLEYLEVEEKFTRLQANIAENRLRSYMAKTKLATMKAPPPKDSEQPKDES